MGGANGVRGPAGRAVMAPQMAAVASGAGAWRSFLGGRIPAVVWQITLSSASSSEGSIRMTQIMLVRAPRAIRLHIELMRLTLE